MKTHQKTESGDEEIVATTTIADLVSTIKRTQVLPTSPGLPRRGGKSAQETDHLSRMTFRHLRKGLLSEETTGKRGSASRSRRRKVTAALVEMRSPMEGEGDRGSLSQSENVKGKVAMVDKGGAATARGKGSRSNKISLPQVTLSISQETGAEGEGSTSDEGVWIE